MSTGALALLTGNKSGRAKKSEEKLFRCRGCPRRFKASQGRSYHEKFCTRQESSQDEDNAMDSMNELESIWNASLEEKRQELKGNFEYDMVQPDGEEPDRNRAKSVDKCVSKTFRTPVAKVNLLALWETEKMSIAKQ